MHEYKSGTCLDSVLGLYHFDRGLRSLLTEGLLKFELNFRTKVIYEVSNAYVHIPCWFVDPSCVEESYTQHYLSKFYENIRKKQKVIQHHHKKYPKATYAPAWKTLEFMTFGQVITLFEVLHSADLKRRIAKYYDLSRIDEFVSYLKILRDLRNACVHGQSLFDYRGHFRVSVAGIPSKSSRPNTVNVFRLVEILSYMLGKIHTPLGKELEARVVTLFSEQPPETLDILRESTGYTGI